MVGGGLVGRWVKYVNMASVLPTRIRLCGFDASCSCVRGYSRFDGVFCCRARGDLKLRCPLLLLWTEFWD